MPLFSFQIIKQFNLKTQNIYLNRDASSFTDSAIFKLILQPQRFLSILVFKRKILATKANTNKYFTWEYLCPTKYICELSLTI